MPSVVDSSVALSRETDCLSLSLASFASVMSRASAIMYSLLSTLYLDRRISTGNELPSFRFCLLFCELTLFANQRFTLRSQCFAFTIELLPFPIQRNPFLFPHFELPACCQHLFPFRLQRTLRRLNPFFSSSQLGPLTGSLTSIVVCTLFGDTRSANVSLFLSSSVFTRRILLPPQLNVSLLPMSSRALIPVFTNLS